MWEAERERRDLLMKLLKMATSAFRLEKLSSAL
jgi:hypothetical protein